MDYGIKDKVALVTGAAGSGLGRADALALAACGAQVAVLDIQSCEETVKLVTKKGGKTKGYTCDISKMDEVTKTVKKINKELGPVTILVNNASILTTIGMFGTIPVDQWNRDIEVNTIGTANVSRAVWPNMIESKWGRIIMMASIAGTSGGLGQTSYSTTKASVIGLGKSLALEGARYNITSNIIAPGMIETSVTDFIRPDMLERMKKATALRRLGKPEEIADTITFLCSQKASYITGQVIGVDGGMGLFVF